MKSSRNGIGLGIVLIAAGTTGALAQFQQAPSMQQMQTLPMQSPQQLPAGPAAIQVLQLELVPPQPAQGQAFTVRALLQNTSNIALNNAAWMVVDTGATPNAILFQQPLRLGPLQRIPVSSAPIPGRNAGTAALRVFAMPLVFVQDMPVSITASPSGPGPGPGGGNPATSNTAASVAGISLVGGQFRGSHTLAAGPDTRQWMPGVAESVVLNRDDMATIEVRIQPPQTQPVTVQLTSSNPGAISVPPSIIVPANPEGWDNPRSGVCGPGRGHCPNGRASIDVRVGDYVGPGNNVPIILTATLPNGAKTTLINHYGNTRPSPQIGQMNGMPATGAPPACGNVPPNVLLFGPVRVQTATEFSLTVQLSCTPAVETVIQLTANQAIFTSSPGRPSPSTMLPIPAGQYTRALPRTRAQPGSYLKSLTVLATIPALPQSRGAELRTLSEP